MVAVVCLMYGWTVDYVLDELTFAQVAYFGQCAAEYNNPDLIEEPDRAKLHRLYGNQKRISR